MYRQILARRCAGDAGDELGRQILDPQTRLREIERELLAWHRSSDIACATIPGLGTICTTAFAASVRRSRELDNVFQILSAQTRYTLMPAFNTGDALFLDTLHPISATGRFSSNALTE